MADADDADIPAAVDPQDDTDIVQQFRHMIADAFFAESAESSQILADLFRCHADAPAELFGRHNIRALRLDQPEGSEI